MVSAIYVVTVTALQSILGNRLLRPRTRRWSLGLYESYWPKHRYSTTFNRKVFVSKYGVFCWDIRHSQFFPSSSELLHWLGRLLTEATSRASPCRPAVPSSSLRPTCHSWSAKRTSGKFLTSHTPSSKLPSPLSNDPTESRCPRCLRSSASPERVSLSWLPTW